MGQMTSGTNDKRLWTASLKDKGYQEFKMSRHDHSSKADCRII